MDGKERDVMPILAGWVLERPAIACSFLAGLPGRKRVLLSDGLVRVSNGLGRGGVPFLWFRGLPGDAAWAPFPDNRHPVTERRIFAMRRLLAVAPRAGEPVGAPLGRVRAS